MSGTGAICHQTSSWHSRVGPLTQPCQIQDLPSGSTMLFPAAGARNARDGRAKEKGIRSNISCPLILHSFGNFLNRVHSLTSIVATTYKPTFALLIALCRWNIWCYAVLWLMLICWFHYVCMIWICVNHTGNLENVENPSLPTQAEEYHVLEIVSLFFPCHLNHAVIESFQKQCIWYKDKTFCYKFLQNVQCIAILLFLLFTQHEKCDKLIF